ncbi:hypothetical protein SERLA73DRAFT_173118 [Serpula lacrymans var. lacrymans S7.3]|uniref:Uncharacterized protein n=2 Tax=Serpula lacrymans var. lacrymans TaxID=341189 RepID=F8QHV0_SERL3|nr:uncharacterized protein SERLADRAFT_450295 [Serpula lacrymans var. lacrymans S7.9]EGN92146.1 hypothetical protein SERLA73DRAFT_173118 [Serpula lacrymans var. lacrymans S7.3]EGO23999.1 hypothetical protein SERLADRAFT_450295 [Serpula lacrymans var. lacrymans S7.9]
MERLCDEVIQLIFYELNDPSALIITSKRFYQLSQDPYVRAHYFLNRYGHIQAMFWALGRGRVVNERVINILITSGASISRYLVQVAMHHYFRTSSHFIKTTWVRSVPLPVFSYFMKVTSDMYGNIPVGKGEDDGSIFSSFLKESRFPPDMKSVKWEEIRDILQMYKFIPFCIKDPIMAQFPIALAIEPRLLPLARANGFDMDPKYRDFVFRKIFERPAVNSEGRMEDIIRNVRELRRLDPRMFLSRTVAAEICMEAKSNEPSYIALRRLDRAGELLFELSTLVEDLIKLFVKTRSITSVHTIPVLRQLYTDFPSTDPTVRLVLLLTVFLSDTCLAHTTPTTLRSKLEPLGLIPLTKADVFNVLTNPFVEKHGPILDFAKEEIGLSDKDFKELVQEVAVKCLEVGCKGKMLKRLHDNYPFLNRLLAEVVVQRYQLNPDDLPPHEDEKACSVYQAKLCRDYVNLKVPEDANVVSSSGEPVAEVTLLPDGSTNVDDEVVLDVPEDDDAMAVDEIFDGGEPVVGEYPELGRIGQDTLSTMIRQDELAPNRSRGRRSFYNYPYYADHAGKLQYPSDPMQVGRWIKDRYHVRSRVMAIFMTHAVVNDNTGILQTYLTHANGSYLSTTPQSCHVPVTLKHFKLLARLGKAPSYLLYHDIETGAEFFFSEEDYLSKQTELEAKKSSHQRSRIKAEVKTEGSPPSIPSSAAQAGPPKAASPRPQKKRPRRSAAASVRSYAIPDSDDEAIAEEDDDTVENALMTLQAKKRKVESNLQRWIKHLAVLLKDEQRKYKEKKKRLEKCAPPDGKLRVAKNEFFKSVAAHLRTLRKLDQEKRKQLYGPDAGEEDYTEDDDDDDYQYRTSKRRRTMN